MGGEKLFSLFVVPACGAKSTHIHYDTLAQAIAGYNSLFWGTDDSILSLHFKGEVIAEDDALSALLLDDLETCLTTPEIWADVDYADPERVLSKYDIFASEVKEIQAKARENEGE